MNGTGAIACFLVAADCAEKAIGAQPQFLFGPDVLWLWWALVAAWAIVGCKFTYEWWRAL